MSNPAADDDLEPTPKKGGKGTLLLAALLLMNLAATALVATKVMSGHGAAAAPTHGEEASALPKAGPVVAVEPFVVNLNETGISRYLKASFELEMSGADAVTALDHAKRGVRDDLLRYLSSLTVADTLGEVGKAKIQDQIVARVDKHLGGGRVRKLFFTEFVVQ